MQQSCKRVSYNIFTNEKQDKKSQSHLQQLCEKRQWAKMLIFCKKNARCAKCAFYFEHHSFMEITVCECGERHLLSGVRAPTCSGTRRNAFSGQGKCFGMVCRWSPLTLQSGSARKCDKKTSADFATIWKNCYILDLVSKTYILKSFGSKIHPLFPAFGRFSIGGTLCFEWPT